MSSGDLRLDATGDVAICKRCGRSFRLPDWHLVPFGQLAEARRAICAECSRR